MKQKISLILKLAVAAALIYFVFRSGNLKLDSLKDILLGPAIWIGFILCGLNIWVLNWRWYWLLRSRRFDISLRRCFSLYLIGIFFNNALPSSVGGDVVKAYYLASEERDRRMEAVLSVLIDRLLGLYSLVLMALAGVAMDLEFVRSHAQIRWMAVACGLVGIAMTAAFVIGFSKRLDRAIGITRFLRRFKSLHKLAEVFDAMHLFGAQRSAIAISVLVSVAGQLLAVLFFMCMAWALKIDGVSIPAFLFCVPIGFVAMALPVAPAGVGVGQVAFLYLFQTYAHGSGELGAASITAYQLTALAWGLIGAIVYVRYKRPMELKEGLSA